MLHIRFLLLIGLVWLAVPALNAEDSPNFTAQAAPQTVTLSGFTQARRSLTVVSEVGGRCTTVSADVGDSVPANGVLACLDDTFIQLDLRANQVEQQRLSAEVAYYDKEITRLKQLTKANSAAQAELDRMVWNRDNSRYQRQSRTVEAQRLTEQQQRSCIYAPAEWQVTQRSLEVGQWVASGQNVAHVSDYRSVLVPLSVTPDELVALQRLAVIPVRFDNADTPVKARMIRRSPAFDPERRKIQIDLEISDAHLNHGGERVSLTLQLPGAANVVEVPRSALLERYEEQYLLRPGGELVKVTLLGVGTVDGSVRVSGSGLIGEQFLRNAQTAAAE